MLRLPKTFLQLAITNKTIIIKEFQITMMVEFTQMDNMINKQIIIMKTIFNKKIMKIVI